MDRNYGGRVGGGAVEIGRFIGHQDSAIHYLVSELVLKLLQKLSLHLSMK